MLENEFYQGKKVFVTGHTGFKGTWLCHMLLELGAEVIGYSLSPPTNPSLFELTDVRREITSLTGDIRDYTHLQEAIQESSPEIVIHLAAQPLVRESYQNPAYTYEINVMGTVNLMEAVRHCESVRSCLNVTTDKVYQNNEWEWGYRESDRLDGFDPYSNSKSCSELVTATYLRALFATRDIGISTVRAGNVLGGGDYSADRIVPDCIRAIKAKVPVNVRNPDSIRPYQHVLEALYAYLVIAQMQYGAKERSGNYNVGPEEDSCITTGTLVTLLLGQWDIADAWNVREQKGPHEANYLKLDCSRIKTQFHWKPCWTIETCIQKTADWYKCWLNQGDITTCLKEQVREYIMNQANRI